MKKLLLIICFLTVNLLHAQEDWENIKFPDKINGEVTSIAVKGDEIYLGTAGDGIWYSDDFGKSWIRTYNDNMLKDSVTNILFSPSGSVFATGRGIVYKTTNAGKLWQNIFDIIRQQEQIHCISVSPLGMMAVGTDRSVFIADKETDGSQFYRISTSLEIFSTISIIVDGNETIFVSGTHDNKNYEIWRFNNQKQGWVQTEKNIETDPRVNDFSLDPNFALFAAVGNFIYQFDYERMIWEKYVEDKDDDVIRVRFEKAGNFYTIGRKYVKVYRRGDKAGTIIPDLIPSKLKDIIITDRGRVLGVGAIDIIISPADLRDVVEWFLSTKFTILDGYSAPYGNRTFKLYKANCDSDQLFIKDVTTSSTGVFSLYLPNHGLTSGDRLKLEKTVFKKNTVKSGHSALDNQMYEIRLNNQRLDSLGGVSYYRISDSKEQTIMLNNTIVYHNLLISVEWDAKREFLDTLASWTRLMSDYLYDVTDGQLIMNKVAIYDNRQKWDQADLRVFASNQVWPNASVGGINWFDTAQAQVRMPRRWWGNGGDTRNMTSSNDWFKINEEDSYGGFMGTSSTMAHELGHYMLGFFDEYVYSDTNKAKLLPDGYNYGFMDYQYQNGNQWSSELSSAVRYPNNNYKITLQWYYNNTDCWTQFENMFSNNYVLDGKSYVCHIKKPSERSLAPGYQYLLGPVDHMTRQNTCSVRNITQVQIFDQNFGGGNFKFTAVDPDGNTLGNAAVYLSRTYGPVTIAKPNQGNTPDNGQMLVLGAEVGDVVSVMYITKIYFPFVGYIDWPAFANFPVGSVTTFDKKDNSEQLEEPRIEVKPIKGTFEFMPQIKYSGGEIPMFEAISFKPFSSGTSADVQVSLDTLINSELDFSSKLSLYSMPLYKIYRGDGKINVKAKDSVGTPFTFPVLFSIQSAKTNNFSNGGDAELSFDNSQNVFSDVAITTTIFPASRNGIASNQEHIGAYFSLGTYPKEITSRDAATLSIRYNPEELLKRPAESLRIFTWDESGKKWVKIGGMVDTAIKIVSSPISAGGIFTLFTEDNATGMDDDGLNGYDLRINPNPVEKNCTILFNSPADNTVQLSLYNALGSQVRNIFSGVALLGANKISLDASALEPGVYFVRLSDGQKVITAKLVIVR
jgi:photosystem II stability/assembly factor-like uncharacterized protein